MSIQKKGDIYYVVITYKDANNKKKHKWHNSGPSIKEAQRFERELRTDIDRGDKVISDKIKVEQFLNQWLKDVIAPKKRPATTSCYQSLIKNIVLGIGNVELDKLTGIKIQQYLNKELKRKITPKYSETPKKKSYKEPKKIEKTISATSVRKQYSLLKQALDKAIAWGLIPKNPCTSVDPPENNKPKQAAYTPEEAQTLSRYAIRDTHLAGHSVRPTSWRSLRTQMARR